MDNWTGLMVMACVLLVAMVLVAWAAFTLGDPPENKPRRPLPYPRHQLHPRHSVPAQEPEQYQGRLVAGYVVTREVRSRVPFT